MRYPVIKFVSLAVVALLLGGLIPVHAQYLWQLPREESFWAIELSGLYNIQKMEMDAVIKDQDLFADVAHDQLLTYFSEDMISGPNTDDEFKSSPMLDIKLGMRAWRIHFGVNFSSDYEAVRKVSLSYENPDILVSGSSEYSMGVTAKEYLFYIGYVQPITSWLEAGVFGSIGPAVADAHQEVVDKSRFYDYQRGEYSEFTYKYDHTVSSEYIAKRIEARVRINVTRNASVDIGIGQRFAQPDDMRGRRKDGQRINQDELAREYMLQRRELQFDYSSTFYSFGITLKNPIEKWGNPLEKWLK